MAWIAKLLPTAILLLVLDCAAPVNAVLSLEVQIHSTSFNSTKALFGPSASPTVTYQLCLKPMWTSDRSRMQCFYTSTSELRDPPLKFIPVRLDNIKGTFMLVVSIFNGTIPFDAADVIDRIPTVFSPELTFQDDFSMPVSFKGERGVASLSFNYRLSSDCPIDYYGHDCSVFCKVSDSAGPNYVCNYLGSLVCKGNRLWPECSKCKPGFYGKDCNLLELQRAVPPSLQGDNSQARDNSSSNSVSVKAGAGTVGAVYGIYIIAGTGLYVYALLENNYFQYGAKPWETALIWLLLYPVYLIVITLLFPVIVCVVIVIIGVHGNK